MKKILLLLSLLTTYAQAIELPDTAPISEALFRLEVFLKQQDEKTPLLSPSLKKPDNEDPLDYYKDVVKAYSCFKGDYQDRAATTHIPEYRNLATLLLKMVEKRCMPIECVNIEALQKTGGEPKFDINKNYFKVYHKRKQYAQLLSSLECEIDHMHTRRETHYQWFMLFCDKLSDLASTLIGIYVTNDINSHYPQYLSRVGLNIPYRYFDDPHYAIGNYATNEFMSLPGLIKNCPGTMMLPYLFELSAYDFLNLAVEGRQLFWPCGLVFQSIAADGWYHCPRMFFGHDWHHLGLLAHGANGVAYKIKSDTLYQPLPLDVAFVYKMASNTLFLYCQTLDALKECIDDMEEGDQKTLYTFFSFYNVHETSRNMMDRLLDLKKVFSPDYEEEQESSMIPVDKSITDPLYYAPFIPETYQFPDIQKQYLGFQKYLREHISSKYVAKLIQLTQDPFPPNMKSGLDFRTIPDEAYSYTSPQTATFTVENEAGPKNYHCLTQERPSLISSKIDSREFPWIINIYYNNALNLEMPNVMPCALVIYKKGTEGGIYEGPNPFILPPYEEAENAVSEFIAENKNKIFLDETRW